VNPRQEPLHSRGTAHPPLPIGRHLFRAFSTPGFRRLWAGSLFWYTTRWIDLFALQWLVLQTTDSAFQASLVAFYRMFPIFVFGLLAGPVADRINRKTVLLFAQLWNALASAALGVLALTGALLPWHIAVLVSMLGFTWALDLPARHSAIHDMVGAEGVVNAIALDLLGMNLAKLLGPVLGGLLWPEIGTGGCLLLLTAGYILNFLNYLKLPSFPPLARSSAPVLRRLTEGIGYALRSPVILGVLAITVVLNFLGFPYQSIGPVLARDTLDLGPRLTGLLLSADGLGAVVTTVVIAARPAMVRQGRVFALGSVGVLIGLILFSLSRSFFLSALSLFAVGCAAGCFGTLQSPLLLLSATPRMRAHTMGALMLAIGFGPLGVLQAGALASWLGPAHAVTLTAGLGFFATVLLAWKAKGLWAFRSGA
jgi:predicted MFS family arabinose efflux permease